MQTVAEIEQQVRADIAAAEARAAQAQAAVETALAEKHRLESFLALLAQYRSKAPNVPQVAPASGGAAQKERPKTQAKASRESSQGTHAIRVLGEIGRPLEIGALADALEAAGVTLAGGDRRNAYLASYLSKDPRVEYVRGSGWWSSELGERPHPGKLAPATEPNEDRHAKEIDLWSADRSAA